MYCLACQQRIEEDEHEYTSFNGVEQGTVYISFVHLACLMETQDDTSPQVRRIDSEYPRKAQEFGAVANV